MRQLEPNDSSAWWIGGGLAAWIGGLIGWGKERFRHACYYVGRAGVARFVAAGDRGQIIDAKRFLFRDAADVEATREERVENGFYHGTDFRFDWLDDGAVVFQITGTYFRDYTGRNPWIDLHFQWGLAAQKAWRNRAK